MTIPELTLDQRIESFMDERISSKEENITFTRKELATFCLREIDYAINLVKSTDIKDIEDQFED